MCTVTYVQQTQYSASWKSSNQGLYNCKSSFVRKSTLTHKAETLQCKTETLHYVIHAHQQLSPRIAKGRDLSIAVFIDNGGLRSGLTWLVLNFFEHFTFSMTPGTESFTVLVCVPWTSGVTPSSRVFSTSYKVFQEGFYYRKRGSASYIVREVLLVRERERYRDRQKWRHHRRAKIGDEFTPSLAKNSHLAMSLHFPCRKFAPFDSPFTLPISPFLNGHHCGALKFAMSSHFLLPKNFALFVPTLSSGGAIVLSIEKMNQVNTKNYWK